MAICFCQIVDVRFDLGTKESLRALLKERLQVIAAGLRKLHGVQFAHEIPRFINWADEFQWRAHCYVIKPNGITWDQIYEQINQVKAVPYDKIPDDRAEVLIQSCYIAEVEKTEAIDIYIQERLYKKSSGLTSIGENNDIPQLEMPDKSQKVLNLLIGEIEQHPSGLTQHIDVANSLTKAYSVKPGQELSALISLVLAVEPLIMSDDPELSDVLESARAVFRHSNAKF